MITIRNEYLTASFNEVGAELKSLICADTQYIWEGKAEIWGVLAHFYSQYAVD